MFNYLHLKYVELFKEWNIWNSEVTDTLATWRLSNLTYEIKSLLAPNCILTIEECLKKGFVEAIDNVIHLLSVESNSVEELEGRVINGCKNILMTGIPDKNSDVYFIYEMIEAFCRYEKTDEDMEKIKKAVYHKNNPYHIGESFYKRLLNIK